MKKQYTKKQITEAIAYWQKQLNEETSKELNIQQTTDDEDQLANVEETRVGEHFLKFIKAVRDRNIIGDYVRNDNKKKYNPQQAIGAALAMIALGFTYRSDSVGGSAGSNKEFYAKCFNNLVETIKRQDYSAAQSLVYIVDHLTEFDEEYYDQRFSTLVDPEVYESEKLNEDDEQDLGYDVDDVMNKVYDKVCHNASGHEDFDRFSEDLVEWVKDELVNTDYDLDEMTEAAIEQLDHLVYEYERERNAEDSYLGGDREDD